MGPLGPLGPLGPSGPEGAVGSGRYTSYRPLHFISAVTLHIGRYTSHRPLRHLHVVQITQYTGGNLIRGFASNPPPLRRRPPKIRKSVKSLVLSRFAACQLRCTRANGGIYCVCRGGPCGPGSIAPNAARSFTELLSSLARGKRLRAPVRLRWAALWLCTEAMGAWRRNMHRLGPGGALSKRVVAWEMYGEAGVDAARSFIERSPPSRGGSGYVRQYSLDGRLFGCALRQWTCGGGTCTGWGCGAGRRAEQANGCVGDVRRSRSRCCQELHQAALLPRAGEAVTCASTA